MSAWYHTVCETYMKGKTSPNPSDEQRGATVILHLLSRRRVQHLFHRRRLPLSSSLRSDIKKTCAIPQSHTNFRPYDTLQHTFPHGYFFLGSAHRGQRDSRMASP